MGKEHFFWIWFLINLDTQIMKPDYLAVERIEDEWMWIRITEGKKWYHRYLDENVRKRLKSKM